MSFLDLKLLRIPRANQISTSVFFYSPKMNRQIWCESNLEWDTAIILDQDPSILEFWEQSIELQWSKSTWIPDFVSLMEAEGKYKILIIEVKYLQELLGDRDHYLQKFTETEEWIRQNFTQIVSQITKLPITQIELLIITDQILHQSFRVRNCRKLIQAAIEKPADLTHFEIVRKIMAGGTPISFQALVNAIKALSKSKTTNDEEIYTNIYSMIYRQEIQMDLDALFTPKSMIFNTRTNGISLEQWFKQYDWRDRSQLYIPLVKHEDLYYIAPTPEKSIALWKIAQARFETISPFLEVPVKQLENSRVQHQGKIIHWSTAYAWIKRYKKAKGDIRSLVPRRSTCGRKKADSNPVFMELWEFGKERYLKRERKSIQHAYNLMESHAHMQGQERYCMSYPSFYRRVQALNGLEVAQKRSGRRNAEKEFELSESEFPHADFPLQSVQIDHTPIDVIVVDEENRQVTTRPYLTIAFDSHTRCVLGYHLTYNDPSRLSIAMTLINCIQDKKPCLEKIKSQFPMLDLATDRKSVV